MKILILAGDTDGNLGDLAIVTATSDAIRSRLPGAEISIISSQQARDCRLLGVKTIARGWRGLPRLAATAARADLVICGGGGLFQDDDSRLKMPYWAVRLTLLRLFARQIAGFSIGAGPLDYRSSRCFAGIALRALDPVTVRDEAARDVVAPLTKKHVQVIPDPAFMLQSADAEIADAALLDAGVPPQPTPRIGVTVRRWFHKHSSLVPYKYASKLGIGKERGQREMSAFVERVAAALDKVAATTRAHVVFMPTYNVAHEADIDVCRRVAERMAYDNVSFLLLDDPKLYKAVTARMNVMLCGRMHPAILAAGHGTPIVGIAYNQKFFGTFDSIGMAENCISINDLTEEGSEERLAARLVAAIERPEAVSLHTEQVEHVEKVVAEFLDDLVGADRLGERQC